MFFGGLDTLLPLFHAATYKSRESVIKSVIEFLNILIHQLNLFMHLIIIRGMLVWISMNRRTLLDTNVEGISTMNDL